MMFGQIDFTGKRVVIVGGGRQALEKGGRMALEGALVVYVAPSFTFCRENKVCLEKTYSKADGKGAFLVYACTSDRELNHVIVLDANENHCLSASVHRDEAASFHGVRQESFGMLNAAVSTEGAYPAFGEAVLEDIRLSYEETYSVRLGMLSGLRKRILKLPLSGEEKKWVLKELVYGGAEELTFIGRAMETGRAFVCVFHGNEEKETYEKIMQFLSSFPPLSRPLYFVYLKETKDSIPTGGKRVFHLPKLAEILKLLSVKDVVYQPMLLEKGYYSKKMEEYLPGNQILGRLIHWENASRFTMSPPQGGQVLLVVHPSGTDGFRGLMENAIRREDNAPGRIQVCELGEKLPTFPPGTKVLLVPGFMLMGRHVKKDIFGEDGIAGQLEAMGCRVIIRKECLLETQVFHAVFLERIMEYADELPEISVF